MLGLVGSYKKTLQGEVNEDGWEDSKSELVSGIVEEVAASANYLLCEL